MEESIARFISASHLARQFNEEMKERKETSLSLLRWYDQSSPNPYKQVDIVIHKKWLVNTDFKISRWQAWKLLRDRGKKPTLNYICYLYPEWVEMRRALNEVEAAIECIADRTLHLSHAKYLAYDSLMDTSQLKTAKAIKRGFRLLARTSDILIDRGATVESLIAQDHYSAMPRYNRVTRRQRTYLIHQRI